jgi:hypothetical protein
LDQKDEELGSIAEAYNKLMVKSKKLESRLAALETTKENQPKHHQSPAPHPDAKKKRLSDERPVSTPASPQAKKQHTS